MREHTRLTYCRVLGLSAHDVADGCKQGAAQRPDLIEHSNKINKYEKMEDTKEDSTPCWDGCLPMTLQMGADRVPHSDRI